MNSRNPYFYKVTQTSDAISSIWPQPFNRKTIHNGHSQHRWHQWTLDAEVTHIAILFSKIGLATKTDRAIDLSCRACGAGAWALGLDSRLGTPASLPLSPPTSD